MHAAGPPLAADGTGGRRIMYVKGAPDRLMPMCVGQLRGDAPDQLSAAGRDGWDALDAKFWRHAQEELSSQGLRVLALCRCARRAARRRVHMFCTTRAPVHACHTGLPSGAACLVHVHLPRASPAAPPALTHCCTLHSPHHTTPHPNQTSPAHLTQG